MTEDATAMAGSHDALGSGAVVVERVVTPRGELVLRRAQAQHEIIHNGVFRRTRAMAPPSACWCVPRWRPAVSLA